MPEQEAKYMKIRTKLTLLLVGLSFAAVLFSSWRSYVSARAALQERVFQQLTTIRTFKAFQIQSYFRTVRQHVLSLSESTSMISGIVEFRTAFQELEKTEVPSALRARIENYYRSSYLPELSRLMELRSGPDEYLPVGLAPYYLQNAYIVSSPERVGMRQRVADAGDGSSYSKVHARFHHQFRKLIDEFSYADLFLIDHVTGRILYTVLKEPDFATSLIVGPYRKTALAEVFEKCRKGKSTEEVFFTDFVAYEPSLGAPAAFACSPVFDGDKMVGIIALQLSSSEIDRIMSGDRGWAHDGLGGSGDAGITGQDYFLRNTSRAFATDPEGYMRTLQTRGYSEQQIARMRAYNTTILQLRVKLPSVEAALRGEEGTAVQQSTTGLSSLISYAPLNVEGLKWTIAARINEDEATAPVTTLRHELIRLTILVLLVTLTAAYIMSRSIVRPVLALVGASREIAAGKLSSRVGIESHDEIGQLSGAFNQMADTIQRNTEEIAHKNIENEKLLLNILPAPIAARLRGGETTIADSFAEVTVMFADIVNFTILSSGRPPEQVVDLLNSLFSRFDAIATRLGVEKIKTIGDAYMAVAGLSPDSSDHARIMADAALEMIRATEEFGKEIGIEMSLRIGLNSGPVVAGVIGATKFIYDLWGDTVNVASRMESHGVAGGVQVTATVYEQLKHRYEFEDRGEIEVKGKGKMNTWMLLHPQGAADAHVVGVV